MNIIHKFDIDHNVTLKYKVYKNINLHHPNVKIKDGIFTVETDKIYHCNIIPSDYLCIDNITLQQATNVLGILFGENTTIDNDDISMCTITCKYNESNDILSKYYKVLCPKSSYSSMKACFVTYTKTRCNIQGIDITSAVNAYLQLYYNHILPKTLQILTMSQTSVLYLVPMDIINIILFMISSI